MSPQYYFFHPLLAADRSWAAIDWHCGVRFGAATLDLAGCFADFGVAPLASQLPIIVPIEADFLEQGVLAEELKSAHLIFALPSATLESQISMARCHELRARGKRFALQIDHVSQLRKVPLAVFNYLCMDAAFARQALSPVDLVYGKDAGFKKIATHVQSHEMFGWLSDKGFKWSDSCFLATRDPRIGKEPDLTRLKLLKLLHLVRSDGDTRAIENIFREEPKLAYNLLRLVNSVAVGARTKISNFTQAITILGRRQLQRWLQLLIYANNLADGNKPNPLMQLAAARGRQLELLAATFETTPDTAEFCDNAFLAGLFSLLDVLINLAMPDILKELPLHDEVMEALLTPGQGGAISQLLAAIIAGEKGDHAAAEKIFFGLGISPAAHASAQVSALYWAARINIENQN